jgi:heavy metal sensor kinase
MNVRSLRVRVAALYVLVLALTFALAGFLVYRFTAQTLHRDLDNLLKLRAEGIAASIDTFWTVQAEEALAAGRFQGSTSKIGSAEFQRLAQRWVEERIEDPILAGLVVQVFGPAARLIAASKNLPGATLLPFEDLGPFLDPAARLTNIITPGEAGGPVRFRAMTLPVTENGQLAYVIRVLSPLGAVETPLRNLRLIMALVLPVVLALSAVAGAWLAGRALRPVDRLTDSARGISAENLGDRLPVPGTRDELSRLAETFNVMLERIEEGFSLHRQFWEDVAHELKTPLAIMKGEIEVALRTGGGLEDSRAVLASNLEEVEGLINLIERMLTLARLDRGGAPAAAVELDLAALAGRAVEDFRGLAEDKGVQLAFAGPDPVPVRGDKDRLRGILYILLDNAVKYTPAGGRVGVDVAADGPLARLAVSDTGPGIPEAELAGVFDRFRRAGRPAEGRGFGLGLSIAKAVAESHGGRIEVRSRPGEGATFTVRLPLAGAR